jgi:hypothetical protein
MVIELPASTFPLQKSVLMAACAVFPAARAIPP